MDVKTTFLNENLTRDAYMTQPKGFLDPKHAGKICKLRKSLWTEARISELEFAF
jgi:hypothetical protein